MAFSTTCTNKLSKYVIIGWGLAPCLEPLLADFILIAQKLEKLGFCFVNSKVILETER